MQLLIWFYVAVVLLDAVLHLHLAQNYILLIENSRGKDTKNASVRCAHLNLKRAVRSPLWPLLWSRSVVSSLRWYVKNK